MMPPRLPTRVARRKNVNRQDLYLQAIRGADGTINVGYLVLFRAGRFVIIVCSVIVCSGFAEMYYADKHVYPIAAVAEGVAKIVAAFGVLLAALGAYLWGDSKQQPLPPSTITTVTATEVK